MKPNKYGRWWLWAVASLLVFSLASRQGFQWFVQDRMLYEPRRYLMPPKDPYARGGRFVEYQTLEGERRWGYRVDPEAVVSTVPPGLPDFYFLFYGGGSTAIESAPLGERIVEMTGVTVFIVEHRGHGFNDGTPNARGLVEDALQAYDVLKHKGDLEQGVGVIGHSRGVAVALALAEQRPVDRLLLVAGATSLKEMARLRRGWWAPLLVREDWPNEARLRRLMHLPESERPQAIGILHGTRDRLVPVEMALQLANVDAQRIELKIYQNSGHNDIFQAAYGDMARFILGGSL